MKLVPPSAGKAEHECELAYTHELMDHTVARDYGAVSYLHVTSQQNSTDDNRAVADFTVMSDVGMIHNKIVIANYCGTLRFCSPVDLRVFSDYVTVAYLEVCPRTLIF